MLSEWNEYGEHPFHSTAYVHTVAYACLNDWDGLILYNYHTSEKADDQPDDEIWSVLMYIMIRRLSVSGDLWHLYFSKGWYRRLKIV